MAPQYVFQTCNACKCQLGLDKPLWPVEEGICSDCLVDRHLLEAVLLDCSSYLHEAIRKVYQKRAP